MRKIVLFCSLAMLGTHAVAEEDFRSLEKKAMNRDYQAQRNLAYVYQTGELGAPKDFWQACVWRTVIVHSGDASVDRSDASNLDYACNKLTPTEKVAATEKGLAMAKRLYKR